jgi:hypothetical protein
MPVGDFEGTGSKSCEPRIARDCLRRYPYFSFDLSPGDSLLGGGRPPHASCSSPLAQKSHQPKRWRDFRAKSRDSSRRQRDRSNSGEPLMPVGRCRGTGVVVKGTGQKSRRQRDRSNSGEPLMPVGRCRGTGSKSCEPRIAPCPSSQISVLF